MKPLILLWAMLLLREQAQRLGQLRGELIQSFGGPVPPEQAEEPMPEGHEEER